MSAEGRPLDGMRVLDFTWVGAGPFCTKILADFGAEVVKVESATRPDQLRKAEPLTGGRTIEESGYFANRNVNKKSVSLDLKNPEARLVALGLARRSDVVINSFSPRVMERFGLGYADIRAVREDIVYVSMPFAGDHGPYCDFLGYGMNIAALVGLMSMGRVEGRWPVGTGTNFPDHIPNPLHAAFAILTAIAERRRSGLGQEIVLSQIGSTLALFPDDVLDFAANGRIAADDAPVDPNAAPHGLYPCLGDDRWCAISVNGDGEFAAVCAVIGEPGLVRDPRLVSHAARRANTAELDAVLAAWTIAREAEEVMNAMQAAGVAAGVVQTAADLVDRDPHLLARGFWQYLDHPVMGRSLYHGMPARISGMDGRYRAPAPLLGQHNDELAALTGMDAETIEALKERNVLR